MALTFYPYHDDAQRGTLQDRIEILMEAAERYKAIVLDMKGPSIAAVVTSPKELKIAYNWEEIAILLSEIRSLPETNKIEKNKKATLLLRLAEIYEVLRAAKMSKLEAVRLALASEAQQLQRGDTATTA